MSNEPTNWYNLSDEQLEKLSTKRLLNILKLARKSMNTSGYCGCCGEPVAYIYGDDSDEVKLAKANREFFNKVKSLCDKLEHVE